MIADRPTTAAAAAPAITVTRITEAAALQPYRDDWHRLQQANPTRTIELTYEWETVFWKHFHDHARLFVLVASREDTVIAIAPLKLTRARRFGLPVRVLEFIAAAESNYQDFLVGDSGPEALAAILDYLARHRSEWDIFNAWHIPDTSPTLAALNAHMPGIARARIAEIIPYLYIPVDKTWDEHAATLTSTTRGQLNNRTNRLRKLGELSLRYYQPDELEARLELFIDLHRKRWNPSETPSQFNDPRYPAFYHEVSPPLMAKGQIDLFALCVDAQPVAMLYLFRDGRTYAIQLITYDPDYSRGSPSKVMHELFMQDVFAGGQFDKVDFGYYHAYKEMWANQSIQRFNTAFYVRRPLPTLVYGLTVSEHALREYLKSFTLLRRFVRAVKSRLLALRRRATGELAQE